MRIDGDRDRPAAGGRIRGSPVIWLLGLTFGSNNSPFFRSMPFSATIWPAKARPSCLARHWCGSTARKSSRLVIALMVADRLQGRAWPFLVFGPLMLGGLSRPDRRHPTALGIVVCRGTGRLRPRRSRMTAILALPPLLSRARRRVAHGGRHVHHQLYLRHPHSDYLRRAVGRDRQAVDGVRAVLHLRRVLTVLGVAVTRGRHAAHRA